MLSHTHAQTVHITSTFSYDDLLLQCFYNAGYIISLSDYFDHYNRDLN